MENKDYVLFSPIGGHDPIGNYSDGPMLRICRVYKPKKVYLFFSKEMWEHRNEDDRYNYCIDRLCEELNIHIEREEIYDENLINVHLFDEFQDKFTQILAKIHRENPESEILVNISSGTPAMKSCLLFLSKMLPFELTAVQVSTPQRRQNPGESHPNGYDVKELWDYNMDANIVVNATDSHDVTRCREEKYTNTLAQITKESICRHIDNYDYDAALRECERIENFVTPHALDLIKAASQRIKINPNVLNKVLSDDEKKVIVPIRESNKIMLFEYLLWLRIKLNRNDLSDFVRGITPALYQLSLMFLKEKCRVGNEKIAPDKYADQYGRLWRDRFEKTEPGKEILKKLDEQYNTLKDRSYLNSDICIFLIGEYYPAENRASVNEKFEMVRAFEEKVRNPISHEIVKVDTAWMDQKAQSNPEGIFEALKWLAGQTFKISPEYWECYEKMNQLIKNELWLGRV